MDGDKITILFLVLVSVFILIFGVSVGIFALKWEKRKKEELIARCTASVQGMLVGIAQSYSSHASNDGYDHYRYDPIVRYDFGGQIYEKTYSSMSSWEGVQNERPITIFVNPNNANEIYVPLPEDVKENRNKKIKKYIIVFVIWCLIAIIGAILTDK
ncbi:MAG: DUF3592 domain-containing protein [Lachnospiraceae bacterium]|nr:DUF3592 domain-containing protein [Lachnospiraceae bacterium]